MVIISAYLNEFNNQEMKTHSSTESRIDCFVINTSPIRSDIEFISRKYWETLTYSLRSSILKDLTTLQDFLNRSSQVLQTVTVTDEQYIEESALKCEQIVGELTSVRAFISFNEINME